MCTYASARRSIPVPVSRGAEGVETIMPRFFFHVLEDAHRFTDETGEVLPDARAAVARGADYARELAGDPDYHGCDVEVTDESGAVIARVPVEPSNSPARN